jgi:RHS repeat-associated protein
VSRNIVARTARLLLFVIAFEFFGVPASTAQKNVSEPQATGTVRVRPLVRPMRFEAWPDATAPPKIDHRDPCASKTAGSIIECENQTLAENVPIVGTPFELYYASDRVPGRIAANAIDIPLSGPDVPAGLVRIDLHITVAGKTTFLAFPPLPNQSYHFIWDGTTAAGFRANRRQPYSVEIGYGYSASPAPRATAPGRKRAVDKPEEVWNTTAGYVGAWNAAEAGFGGWTLDVGHFYDRDSKLFYYGDGTTRDLSLLGVSANATTYPSPDGNEVYDLDDAGRHVRTRDAVTGATKYTLIYDPSGRLATVIDRGGLKTTIERNPAGDATAIVAPGGQRTALSIGSDGFLRDIADPAGEGDHYTYTNGGLLTTYADHRSNVHTFTWNDVGRLAKDVDPDGGSTTLTRTDTPATTDIPATATVAESTAAGRMRSIVTERFANGDDEKSITDEAGLVTQSSHALNDSTAATLPDGTRITQQTQPDPIFGSAATYVGSSRVTLPSGLSLAVEQSRVVLPAGITDPSLLSSATQTVTMNGRTWKSAYAAPTKTWTDTTPSGRISAETLDAAGRIVSARTGSLSAVLFGYDNLGRLATTEQGGRTNRIGYNDQNYVASTTDGLGHVTRFSYDAAGRATRVTLAANREIGLAYDPSGNTTTVTTPTHAVHSFTYTATGLLASYTAPGTSDAIRYEYDADHHLIRVTRPDGTSIVSDYDTAGRLSSVRTQEDYVRYGYDFTSGMPASISNVGEELRFENDGHIAMGALWNGVVTGSVRRTIDADFRTATETVCASECGTASFTYDPDGLLYTAAGTLFLQRDPQNGFVTQSSAGRFAESYTYNEFGEQTGYSLISGGIPVMTTTYGRDALGRITTRNEQLNGLSTANTYAYDATGRLVSITTNGATTTYSYDDNRNRLKRSSGVTDETGDYDQQDRLLHYNGATFAYTAAGELRSRTDAAGTTTYSYDALGNLRHVSLPDRRFIDYVIDGRNRRIGVKVNGTLVRGWIYADDLQIVGELDGAGALVSRFVYGTRSNIPDLMIRSGETYRFVTDERGSVRLVVNVNAGAVAQRLDYDEFGRVTVDTAPSFQPFGFAGGLHDPYTGFVRFGARDYDPQTGRWTTRDPIGFRGRDTNLYQYVAGDPVNFIDPEGKDWDWFFRYFWIWAHTPHFRPIPPPEPPIPPDNPPIDIGVKNRFDRIVSPPLKCPETKPDPNPFHIPSVVPGTPPISPFG